MSDDSKRIRLSPRELDMIQGCVAIVLKLLRSFTERDLEDLEALDVRLKDPTPGGQTAPVRAARKRLAKGADHET